MTEARRTHAPMDLQSRRWKGTKIERLLGLNPGMGHIRMLEIGTGSGGIANYFATHPVLDCEVHAVDVVDGRRTHEGFQFSLVEGTKLPYEDFSFDVVLTNHVIEHVGNAKAQLAHLQEVRRVMADTGAGYLAVPNRWMLVEPHYRLAFLSWLPHAWRTPYLRAMRAGSFYDCEPLQLRQLERMLGASGLEYCNLGVKALRETFEIEHPAGMTTRLLRCVPDASIEVWRRAIPTLIYRICRAS